MTVSKSSYLHKRERRTCILLWIGVGLRDEVRLRVRSGDGVGVRVKAGVRVKLRVGVDRGYTFQGHCDDSMGALT